jgi:hypothetical protein
MDDLDLLLCEEAEAEELALQGGTWFRRDA